METIEAWCEHLARLEGEEQVKDGLQDFLVWIGNKYGGDPKLPVVREIFQHLPLRLWGPVALLLQ